MAVLFGSALGVVHHWRSLLCNLFFVIYRILRLDSDSVLKPAVLALALFMMVVNALWNYVFFRAQNLFLWFIGASLFPILDIALFICLIQLDKVIAWQRGWEHAKEFQRPGTNL